MLGLRIVAVVWLGQVLEEAFTGKTWRGALTPAEPCSVPGPSRRRVPDYPHSRACGNPARGSELVFPWLGTGSSPFQLNYLKRFVLTPPGMAYYALLGLGVLSFLLNLPRWPWHRFLPWFVLALLSAFHLPMVPFFAVVAGPVLALNLHEILAWSFDLRQPYLVRSLLTAALGLVLVLCAWTGWLQGARTDRGRWTIETVPSLEQGVSWPGNGRRQGSSQAASISPRNGLGFCLVLSRGEKSPGCLPVQSDCHTSPGSRRGCKLAEAGTLHIARTMRSKGVNHVILYDAEIATTFWRP